MRGAKIFLFLMISVAGAVSSAQAKTIKKPAAGYAKHLEASKKFSSEAIKNAKKISIEKRQGKLLSVKMLGKGYRIQKLDYSRPVLVPKAKDMLLAISKDFYKKSKGSTLTFTSLTRTVEDQKRLRKVNGNAAEGLSSHNFGNSFDISYVRFNDRLKENPRLTNLLEKMLVSYQNMGKIYYIRERKQSCFHVTVR